MPTNNFPVGEMLNRRTKNSKTWINFDGSYTTEIYSGMVHYEDENGNLHNINTDLFDEADIDTMDEPINASSEKECKGITDKVKKEKDQKTLNRELYDFQTFKTPFFSKIPRNFKKGYAIGYGQDKLSFIPVGSSPAQAYVEGNKAIYGDPWNDTDVTLEVTKSGIKETIILKTNNSPDKFTFEVKGPLADDLTAGDLKLGPAWLVDANGIERDVEQTIRRPDGKIFIDLVADVTGLAYPIEIDPTVTLTNGVISDTYIRTDTTDNEGDGWGLRCGTYGTGTDKRYIPFFDFDFSSIPSGSTVISSTISVYRYGHYDSAGKSFYIRPQRITQTWDENTVYNSPSSVHDGDPDVLRTNDEPDNVWIDIDVSNAVKQKFAGNTFHGILFNIVNNESWFNEQYRTTEYEDYNGHSGPRVSVTYNSPPNSPTVTSPNGGEFIDENYTITWDAGSDNDTANSGLQYNIQLSTNNGSTWKNIASLTSAGTTSYTYNFANEPETSTALIRIRTYDGSLYSGFDYSNANFTIKHNYPPNSPTVTSPNGGETIDTTHSITWNHATDDKTTQSNLRYNIQLSTDNGSSWSNIVSLTTGTSYNYDFSNQPETSTALIRIRAYDGEYYGPFDQSNGVFEINHNAVPLAPLNLSPNGDNLNRLKSHRFSWTHNDDGTQAGYRIAYRPVGGSWTYLPSSTTTYTSTNEFHDFDASFFGSGDYEWLVRTVDQGGLMGPFSNAVPVRFGEPEDAPTILTPTVNESFPIPDPTIEWSALYQQTYELVIYRADNDAVVWSSKPASSSTKAITVGTPLDNNTNYYVSIRILSSRSDLWSEWSTVFFSTSFSPPITPSIYINNYETSNTIGWYSDDSNTENPPTDPINPTEYIQVFRKRTGTTEWTMINNNMPVNGSVNDYTPATDTDYDYKVRAWGDTGTYADSEVVSTSISFSSTYLSIAGRPSEVIELLDTETRDESIDLRGGKFHFSGRRLPIWEHGEHEENELSVTWRVYSSVDKDRHLDFITSREVFLYRDNAGRRKYCIVTRPTVNDLPVNGYEFTITLIEIDYKEGVE